MRAFHSFWSAPFKARNPHKEFYISELDILTTVLSALYWRKTNGEISMICDQTAYDFYKSIGLLSLWNDGVYVALDDIPNSINPNVFWAAGKLYALESQKAPCVMLDTDFIVWDKINFNNIKIGAIHSEELIPQTYPNQTELCYANGFDFNGLDWTVHASNTAFCYFGDNDFKRIYTETAKSFMLSAPNADNPLTYMVFAEQRLLSMLAKKHCIDIHYFSDIESLFTSGQKKFTHVWGFKQQASQSGELMSAFCRQCISRIKRDFPEYYNILSKIPSIYKYM